MPIHVYEAVENIVSPATSLLYLTYFLVEKIALDIIGFSHNMIKSLDLWLKLRVMSWVTDLWHMTRKMKLTVDTKLSTLLTLIEVILVLSVCLVPGSDLLISLPVIDGVLSIWVILCTDIVVACNNENKQGMLTFPLSLFDQNSKKYLINILCYHLLSVMSWREFSPEVSLTPCWVCRGLWNFVCVLQHLFCRLYNCYSQCVISLNSQSVETLNMQNKTKIEKQ